MTSLMDQLIQLQDLDRKRDRLQKKLDQVPQKLKAHSDAVEAATEALRANEDLLKQLRTEIDRNELEIKTKEGEREECRTRMSSPNITAKEYEILQQQLATLFAELGELTERGVKAMQKAEEAESALADLRTSKQKAEETHASAKEKLLDSLGGVNQELDQRNQERSSFVEDIERQPLQLYERVRAGLKGEALAAIDGTIDRAAGRMGNDLHCSACYMTITPNDAIQVLAGKEIVRCKSCTRILYVP